MVRICAPWAQQGKVEQATGGLRDCNMLPRPATSIVPIATARVERYAVWERPIWPYGKRPRLSCVSGSQLACRGLSCDLNLRSRTHACTDRHPLTFPSLRTSCLGLFVLPAQNKTFRARLCHTRHSSDKAKPCLLLHQQRLRHQRSLWIPPARSNMAPSWCVPLYAFPSRLYVN